MRSVLPKHLPSGTSATRQRVTAHQHTGAPQRDLSSYSRRRTHTMCFVQTYILSAIRISYWLVHYIRSRSHTWSHRGAEPRDMYLAIPLGVSNATMPSGHRLSRSQNRGRPRPSQHVLYAHPSARPRTLMDYAVGSEVRIWTIPALRRKLSGGLRWILYR